MRSQRRILGCAWLRKLRVSNERSSTGLRSPMGELPSFLIADAHYRFWPSVSPNQQGSRHPHNQSNLERHLADRQTLKARRSAALAECSRSPTRGHLQRPKCIVQRAFRTRLTAPPPSLQKLRRAENLPFFGANSRLFISFPYRGEPFAGRSNGIREGFLCRHSGQYGM